MIILVKLHPASSQEKIEKFDNENYKVWIKSKPIDGKANEELCKILKKHFNAKEAKIRSGLTSRIKRIEVIK